MYLSQVFSISLFFCISTTLGDKRAASNKTCAELYKEVDKCGQQLFVFGNRNAQFPYTEETLTNEHCPRIKKAEKCLKSYSRQCLQAFPQQVLLFLISGAVKQRKKQCETQRSKLLTALGCWKGAGADDNLLHTCMDTFVTQVESTNTTVADNNLKMPYVCCSFYHFKKCLRREMSKKCKREEDVNFITDLIHGMAAEVMSLTCSNYEENSGNCRKLAPLRLSDQKRHQSIIPAAIDIYTNL